MSLHPFLLIYLPSSDNQMWWLRYLDLPSVLLPFLLRVQFVDVIACPVIPFAWHSLFLPPVFSSIDAGINIVKMLHNLCTVTTLEALHQPSARSSFAANGGFACAVWLVCSLLQRVFCVYRARRSRSERRTKLKSSDAWAPAGGPKKGVNICIYTYQ